MNRMQKRVKSVDFKIGRCGIGILLSLWVVWGNSGAISNPVASGASLNQPEQSSEVFNDKPTTLEEWKIYNRQLGLWDETVMVPMRDGIALSTTVFKPPFSGAQPVILVRTPYDKGMFDELQIVLLSGYNLVIQNTRGRFGSQGEDRVFLDDGWGKLQDGYDTIEWIAKQSWCNGKVGTWGPSAMGILQGLAAGARPPHLVCQVIGYASVNGYGQTTYQGGAFRKELVEGWLTDNKQLYMLPIYLQHPTLDDFWAQLDIASKQSEINVPALFVGGFYDCFEQGTLDNFVGRQTLGAPGAKGMQKLVMGPWTHTNELKAQQGQLTYPTNSVYSSEITETLDWYDYWLKGKENGVMKKPAVTYYVMGDVSASGSPGNEWRTSSAWPPQSQSVPFYLQADGTLSTFAPTASLLKSKELILDPAHPAPTVGGMNLEIPGGPYDQKSLEIRDDVLIFSADSLPNPVEVVGRVKAVLYAESNLTDNDLTVRLADVYPDGRSMLLCDGIARASFRDSYTSASPIVPGTVYRYEVDLWSTSIVFNKGHRIRILVANTNYPRFEWNPVYKSLGLNGLPQTAKTVVHYSKEYPSSLWLPVVAGVTNVSGWRDH